MTRSGKKSFSGYRKAVAQRERRTRLTLQSRQDARDLIHGVTMFMLAHKALTGEVVKPTIEKPTPRTPSKPKVAVTITLDELI